MTVPNPHAQLRREATALAKKVLEYVTVNGKRPPKAYRLDADERLYDMSTQLLKTAARAK